MRNIQLVLFTAIAVLGLAISAQAAPIITPLGNYNLLPNTPGQKIPLFITGIVPNDGPTFPLISGSVHGMVLSVAISGGGVAFGGTPGPIVSAIDVDSGPTIWVAPNSPAGHNPPFEYYAGQLAQVNFLVPSGWVNVADGLLATLIVDTTGFNIGTYSLTLSSPMQEENTGDTVIIGYFGDDFVLPNLIYYDGPAGQITIVPEPSSVVLAAIGLIGLAAWGWRRKRAMH